MSSNRVDNVSRMPSKKVTKKPATKAVKKKAVKRVAKKTVKTTAKKDAASTGATPTKAVDARIKAVPGWQGQVLARVRRLIKQAEPDVIEELKWAKPSNAMTGVPVWSHDGIICTGETYKDKVKLTFAKGASLKDPARLFNSSLEGNTRRALDIFEGDTINETAFKSLIREAAVLNESKTRR